MLNPRKVGSNIRIYVKLWHSVIGRVKSFVGLGGPLGYWTGTKTAWRSVEEQFEERGGGSEAAILNRCIYHKTKGIKY